MRLLCRLFLFGLVVGLQAHAEIASVIAQGERIALPGLGFSLVPPKGWEVQRNSHGASLLFEAPKASGQIYQPTIQVMVFSEPRYIDTVTQKEFGDLIQEKFSKISNRMNGFRVRSSEIIPTETGDLSLLYYTEFLYDDVAIMQMHILVSSASNHFLMTYTDLAKSFEDENAPGLVLAYTTMHSAQLESKPDWRFKNVVVIASGITVLVLAFFGFRWLRSRQVTQLGQRVEDEESEESLTDEDGLDRSQYVASTKTQADTQQKVRDAFGVPDKASGQVSTLSRRPHRTEVEDDDEHEISEAITFNDVAKNNRVQSLRVGSNQGVNSKPPAWSLPPPLPVEAKQNMPSAPSLHDVRGTVDFDSGANPISSFSEQQTTVAIKIDPQAESEALGFDNQVVRSEKPIQYTSPKSMPQISVMSEPYLDQAGLTEEAHLSEILPKAGTIAGKAKRKSFFWNKNTTDDDDDAEPEESETFKQGNLDRSRLTKEPPRSGVTPKAGKSPRSVAPSSLLTQDGWNLQKIDQVDGEDDEDGV